jgi:hypothetical protein
MSRPTAVEAVDNCGVRSCRLDSRGWPAGEWHESGRMRAVGWNAEWDLVCFEFEPSSGTERENNGGKSCGKVVFAGQSDTGSRQGVDLAVPSNCG